MNDEINYPVVANYSFKINIDGYPLKVTYRFRFLSDFPLHEDGSINFFLEEKLHFVRFQFFGITASESGYRSHFCQLLEIESNPYEYALIAGEYLYNEVKKSHPEKFTRQLSLF